MALMERNSGLLIEASPVYEQKAVGMHSTSSLMVRGRGVPGGVAARFKRGAQTAGREEDASGSPWISSFGEAHDGAAVAHGVEEAVVLLGRDTAQGWNQCA